MPTTVLFLLTGLAIAAIALAASGGHLIFLPLFFVVRSASLPSALAADA